MGVHMIAEIEAGIEPIVQDLDAGVPLPSTLS
jgi:hypothetical protein